MFVEGDTDEPTLYCCRAVIRSIHQGNSNKKHVAFGSHHRGTRPPSLAHLGWWTLGDLHPSTDTNALACCASACRSNNGEMRHGPRMNSIHRKQLFAVYHQEIGIRLHGTGRASSGVLDSEPARNQRQIFSSSCSVGTGGWPEPRPLIR